MAKRKVFFKVFLAFFLVFVLTVSIAPKTAYAQDACGASFVQWDQRLFCMVRQALGEIDIRRSVMNMFRTMGGNLFTFLALERSADETGVCSLYILGEMIRTGTGFQGVENRPVTGSSGGTTIQDGIDAATAIINDPSVSPNAEDCDFSNLDIEGRNSGSLAGVTQNLYNRAKEPLPINLAYYFKDVASRTPLIRNTAFAQVTYEYAMGYELVYRIWQTFRNIAYGIIAVIMLVVGMMIMSKRKVNPQLTVTAQTALPRIVIALVLITMSYPIGATLASAITPLTVLIGLIVFGGTVQNVIDADLLVAQTGLNTALLGGGQLAIILSMLVFIICLGMVLIMLIKSIVIYAKLMISVVLSPLIFALGAVPGNEKSTADLLKSMAANALSIPIMFGSVFLAWWLLGQALLNYVNFMGTSGDFFLGAVPTGGTSHPVLIVISQHITLLMVPIMMIAIMAVGLRANKEVRILFGLEKRR